MTHNIPPLSEFLNEESTEVARLRALIQDQTMKKNDAIQKASKTFDDNINNYYKQIAILTKKENDDAKAQAQKTNTTQQPQNQQQTVQTTMQPTAQNSSVTYTYNDILKIE